MSRWTCLSLALAAVAMPAEAAPLRVAVIPVEGTAPLELRRSAAAKLVNALRGIEALQVIDLAVAGEVLGPSAPAALAACRDDRCIAGVIAPLATARAVVGVLSAGEGTRPRLDLRLVDTSTPAALVRVRISRDLEEPLAAALDAQVPAIAAELFPELSSEGAATLTLKVRPAGAAISIDGTPVGLAPLAPLRVKPGVHRVRIEASAHHPEEISVAVGLGQSEAVEISLSKNRSPVPLFLAGGSLAAVSIGLVFGLSAQAGATAWDDACGTGACEPGFTRARYDRDGSDVARDRVLANVFFAAAGGLAIGALAYFLLDPGVEVSIP